VADAVNIATENRPELRQQNLSKEINQINIDYFRNQAKPQIDLIASYRTDGLGGTGPTATIGNCSGPSLVKDPVTGQSVCAAVIPTAQNGVLVPVVASIPFTTTTSLPASSQFIGGYGTALGNLFKNQFRTWQVGLQINLPIRNRAAKANLGRAIEDG